MLTSLLAIAVSVASAVVLIGAILYLRRSLKLIRKLSFVLLVGAFAASLAVYKFMGGPLPTDFAQVYTWVVTFLAAVAVLRLIGLYLFDIHFRAHRGVHLAPMLAPAIQGAAYLIAAFVLLKILFPALDLAPLIATSAVGSLVLGLALQPLLTNLFAGIVISLEQPFRLDDWVKVAGTDGRVVEVTWRTTHIRTRDNDNLIIPNGKIAEENVLNYDYPNRMHQERLAVGAHYDVPPYRVRHALLESVRGVKGILEKPSPGVLVKGFGDSAINYELEFWIDDMAALEETTSDLSASVWESFKRHGVSIPFPTRTLEFAPRKSPKAATAPTAGGRLFIAEGSGTGATIELGDRPVIIGREASSGLRLTDAQTSKEHARVAWNGTCYTLVDLGSTFGTLVNGERVERRELQPLDRITIGSTVLVFEV